MNMIIISSSTPSHHNHLCSSIIREKSSKHTNPSLFLSTPSIMRRHSSNVHRSSPMDWKNRSNSSAEIFPSWSVSKTSNTSFKSSESQAGSQAGPTRLMKASTLMHPSPSRSTSLSIRLTSSWLGGWEPRRVSNASSSSREMIPSLSRSMSLNAWANSYRKAPENSHQSLDISGRTLVGVLEPAVPLAGLWTDPSEEGDDDVPELNDDGSDLDTVERSFLEPNKCFGLSLRNLGLSLRYLGLILIRPIGDYERPRRRRWRWKRQWRDNGKVEEKEGGR